MSNTISAGNSRFANDFLQVIERSVAIASLPLNQLKTQKTSLADQSAALKTLESKFSALQTSVTNLAAVASAGALDATFSDNTVARARIDVGATESTYNLEVVSLGSRTTAFSSEGLIRVTDAATQNISSSSSFVLTVDGVDHTIGLTTGSLSELAQKINGANAGVSASVVNVGSSANPDYRLSVRAARLGSATVALSDGSQNVLDTLVTGTPAQYRVNGGPASPIESDFHTVTIAPGVEVDLLKTGETEITVGRSASAIEEALGAFVKTFNEAVGEIDKHRGQSGGALAGQSLLSTLSDTLRGVAAYSNGTDALSSLAALGIAFDQTGRLSLDSEFFQSAMEADSQAVFDFLGEPDASGFLQSATDFLKTVDDSTNGLLNTAIGQMDQQIQSQDLRIRVEEERIQFLRDALNARMAAADALIASLEQQATYMNGLIEAMRGASN